MLELLSPAGSPEAVVAAVQSGADAIYLGLEGFNARRGAKNFTQQEFIDSVTYCHARGCKVYVAINTLASDRELKSVAELGAFAYENGADAAIVQDLGISRVLRSVCPELAQHASTQLGVHNLAGAIAAADMGMKRVVLARELSLEQIRYIASKSPIETEVFVHGALCFCHSGQCYMSSFIGRRSGNRGACAQPCRLPYGMGRRAGGHPLSLKDNCLLGHLKALEEAGVACIKIEGRMKRPEYTAVTARVYAKALREGVEAGLRDMEELEAAFSRDGFTDGYLTGKKDEGMFGVRREQDRDAEKFFASVRREYASGELRRVPVSFYADVKRGEPFRLTAKDEDGNKVSVTGPSPQSAQSRPLTEKSLSDQLYKTGGTQYRCKEASAKVEEELFLPSSEINEVRRQALIQLTEKRVAPKKHPAGVFPLAPKAERREGGACINIQVSSPGQLNPAMAELDIKNVYVPVEILAESAKSVLPFVQSGKNIVAVLPRVITDMEAPEIAVMLKKAKDLGVREALVGNLGHIALARLAGLEVRGDFGLNVFNSYTVEMLKRAGLKSVTASFELRLAQIRDLVKSLDTEIIAYGRLPLMVTDQCVIKTAAGSCSCSGVTNMSDRMGSVFPVVREFGCRNVILNSHKLFLADKVTDLEAAGLWGIRLCFTTESPRECAEITKSNMGLSTYKPNGLTRGLYYRGVE